MDKNAIRRTVQTELKITKSVFTKIRYLSGALELHDDSSHFSKTHSSAQNSGKSMDFKVLYRFLTIKKMEEVNRNFKSRFHDNKNQNQKPKLSGYVK